MYVDVIDYVEISGMNWTSTLFQAENKQTNKKTKKNNNKKKTTTKRFFYNSSHN